MSRSNVYHDPPKILKEKRTLKKKTVFFSGVFGNARGSLNTYIYIYINIDDGLPLG